MNTLNEEAVTPRIGHLWTKVAILIAGAAARIPLLGAYRFHADEALFATLARHIADGTDPLLAHTTLLVDKPPLFYLMLSTGVALEWGSEMAARLPGLFGGLVSIALIGRIAKRLWGSDRAGLLAMALTALTPMAILHSSAALADPLMIVFWLAAIAAALEGATFVTFLMMALSICVKQNAGFFAPLPLLLWLAHRRSGEGLGKQAALILLGAGIPLAITASWEMLRLGAEWVFFTGGAVNNPGRLARSSELWPHLLQWGRLSTDAFGGLIPTALILVGLVAGILLIRRSSEDVRGHWRLVGAVAIANGALLWLVAFPLFDRYLLPLVIMIILLAAKAWGDLITVAGDNWKPITAGLPLAIFAISALIAASAPAPIGPFSTADDGIDAVSAYLSEKPPGKVVYTETLGWQLSWALYDAPVYLAVFANPAALTDDLVTHMGDGSERYLVLPAAESAGEVYRAIEAAEAMSCLVNGGMDRYGHITFRVIQIVPRAAGICPAP